MQHDGNTLARLVGDPEPLDASRWHLVPAENGYHLCRWRDGVLFNVLAHGEQAREALVAYLLENGASVGPMPSQDSEALEAWQDALKAEFIAGSTAGSRQQ